MGLTPEQIKARRTGIGASDVGAILGMNPWKTPVDIWYDKVHGSNFKGNSATARGNRWEPRVLADYEEWKGRKVEADPQYTRYYTVLRNGIEHKVRFTASCDAIVIDDRGLEESLRAPSVCVEAKTAHSMSSWGLPGTDQVPDSYLLQTFCQIWCSGAKEADIPVLCGFDFFNYNVKRPPEDELDKVIQTCAEWWVDFVVTETRPEGPPPKVTVLASIERDEDEAIELSDDVVECVRLWQGVKSDKAEIIKAEAEMRAGLIEKLGEASVGVHDTGELTYFANSRGVRSLKWNRRRESR